MAGSETKLKIAGLTLGNPFDPSSRSGVNASIFSRLKKQCDLVGVFDMDLKGAYKLWSAISHFSLNRRKWGNKLHQNPWAFRVRTRQAAETLQKLGCKLDMIYQDGAMFMPGFSPKWPFASYHDSNVLLSARGGIYAQGAHYKGRSLRATFEQEKMVYSKAAIVFSTSDWLKGSLVKDFLISEKKIFTVYSGTNLESGDFHKNYDGKTILFVGRNFQRKGGKTLLRAFELVRREIKEARLIIVGPKLKIRGEGIENPGPISDKKVLAQYFKDASIFVLPSLYEPFGIVFAEALSFHVPCIGTNICAMPEIIDDGKSGFVVKPNDHVSLADRIVTLLKDERLLKEMGAYGYEKARNLFKWDSVVDKIVKQCSKVV